MDGSEHSCFSFFESDACELPADRYGRSLRVEVERETGSKPGQIRIRLEGAIHDTFDGEKVLCDFVWWYRVTPKGLARALDLEREFESSDEDL